MAYLFDMLDALHISTSPGDSRGLAAQYRDSRQQFVLNLPPRIVEEYV